jgi:hypothetical protein
VFADMLSAASDPLYIYRKKTTNEIRNGSVPFEGGVRPLAPLVEKLKVTAYLNSTVIRSRTQGPVHFTLKA